jgi:hypothetical protein
MFDINKYKKCPKRLSEPVTLGRKDHQGQLTELKRALAKSQQIG